MSKRVRLDKNARSKSKYVTSAPAPRWTLFGQPPLLDGEDAAAYDELLARIHAAVKPGDIIDEMLISDVASLEWEVLRWRRLELSLIRARGLAALERFLANQLEYCSYADQFAGDLERILKDHVKEGEDPHSLARGYAENEMGAVQQIKIICDYNRVYLHDSRLDLQDIMNCARDRKAKELVQQYARGEPEAAVTVRELLSNAGVSMDSFMADALANNLDDIERIDRLTAIAENSPQRQPE